MFKLENFSQSNKDIFYRYLKDQALNSKDIAAKNMWDESKSKSSLVYILENTDRFLYPNGEFNILFYNSLIVGCAGVYKSLFSNEIALAGTRAWLSKEFRNKHILREYFLPNHKLWAKMNYCKAVALCFNEYNKSLIKVFKRTRLGESSSRVNFKEPKHLFYNGICEIDFPVIIQHTKQYVIYEKLDTNFMFDWQLIKYNN